MIIFFFFKVLVPPPTCHEKVPPRATARFARAQNRPWFSSCVFFLSSHTSLSVQLMCVCVLSPFSQCSAHVCVCPFSLLTHHSVFRSCVCVSFLSSHTSLSVQLMCVCVLSLFSHITQCSAHVCVCPFSLLT